MIDAVEDDDTSKNEVDDNSTIGINDNENTKGCIYSDLSPVPPNQSPIQSDQSPIHSDQTRIQALDAVTDTTVLANPKILVLNRQRAELLVGEKLGYLSSTATDTSTTQSVEFLEIGTQLTLRPFVSNDGFIRLELKPSISDGNTSRTVGSFVVPETTNQELTTNVVVRNGQTIVLGGLFKEDVEVARRQVPFFGDIPLLGVAFKGQDDIVSRNEVIFLITPTIVRDDQLNAIGDQVAGGIERARLGAREGLLPWSETKLKAGYVRDARGFYDKGDTEKALWAVNMALTLDPKSNEAIKIKEMLTGKRLYESTNFSILNKAVDDLLDRGNGAADRGMAVPQEHGYNPPPTESVPQIKNEAVTPDQFGDAGTTAAPAEVESAVDFDPPPDDDGFPADGMEGEGFTPEDDALPADDLMLNEDLTPASDPIDEALDSWLENGLGPRSEGGQIDDDWSTPVAIPPPEDGAIADAEAGSQGKQDPQGNNDLPKNQGNPEEIESASQTVADSDSGTVDGFDDADFDVSIPDFEDDPDFETVLDEELQLDEDGFDGEGLGLEDDPMLTVTDEALDAEIEDVSDTVPTDGDEEDSVFQGVVTESDEDLGVLEFDVSIPEFEDDPAFQSITDFESDEDGLEYETVVPEFEPADDPGAFELEDDATIETLNGDPFGSDDADPEAVVVTALDDATGFDEMEDPGFEPDFGDDDDFESIVDSAIRSEKHLPKTHHPRFGERIIPEFNERQSVADRLPKTGEFNAVVEWMEPSGTIKDQKTKP